MIIIEISDVFFNLNMDVLDTSYKIDDLEDYTH